MTKEDLVTFYDYACWANEKIFTVVEALSNEEFTRDIAGAYGSVRNTMVHTLSAEWGWMGTCGGPVRRDRLSPEKFSTAADLIAKWRSVSAEIRAFLQHIDDDYLEKTIEYPGAGGVIRALPAGELIHHAINHGVHHRGQVATLLRVLGKTAGNFDILFYYGEKRGVEAW